VGISGGGGGLRGGCFVDLGRKLVNVNPSELHPVEFILCPCRAITSKNMFCAMTLVNIFWRGTVSSNLRNFAAKGRRTKWGDLNEELDAIDICPPQVVSSERDFSYGAVKEPSLQILKGVHKLSHKSSSPILQCPVSLPVPPRWGNLVSRVAASGRRRDRPLRPPVDSVSGGRCPDDVSGRPLMI
jgi:hypothetical protein